MRSSTSRGSSPAAVRTARPVAMRRLSPATRTMKYSSRLFAKIARKRVRSSSGTAGSIGELEHPLVELQPRQLALEVAVGGQLVLVVLPTGADEAPVGCPRRACAGSGRCW